jgi:hypothetical protein
VRIVGGDEKPNRLVKCGELEVDKAHLLRALHARAMAAPGGSMASLQNALDRPLLYGEAVEALNRQNWQLDFEWFHGRSLKLRELDGAVTDDSIRLFDRDAGQGKFLEAVGETQAMMQGDTEWVEEIKDWPEPVKGVASGFPAFDCYRFRNERDAHVMITLFSHHKHIPEGGDFSPVTFSVAFATNTKQAGRGQVHVQPKDLLRCGCGGWLPPTQLEIQRVRKKEGVARKRRRGSGH